MDEAAKWELRELEAKCTIVKHELDVVRAKLKDRERDAVSAVLHYRDTRRRLEALYNEDEEAHEALLQFKLRHGIL